MHSVGMVATPRPASMGSPEQIILYIDSGTITVVSSGETMTLRAERINAGYYRIIHTADCTGVEDIVDHQSFGCVTYADGKRVSLAESYRDGFQRIGESRGQIVGYTRFDLFSGRQCESSGVSVRSMSKIPESGAITSIRRPLLGVN